MTTTIFYIGSVLLASLDIMVVGFVLTQVFRRDI